MVLSVSAATFVPMYTSSAALPAVGAVRAHPSSEAARAMPLILNK